MPRLVDHPGVTIHGKTIGRPRKHPPDDAAARIEACAADGFSAVGIAARFGTSADVLRRWLEEDPVLRQAFDRGRETERHTLHNVLYRAATELGNTTAAMFLLKARHGYREGDQGEQANRVQITFTLPGAMQPEQFTIQANDRSTENQPVSRAVLERS